MKKLPAPLPKGFVDLASAYDLASPRSNGGLVSIIGVVIDPSTPGKSRNGPDFQIFFKLIDPSLGNRSQSLSVRFFKPNIADLPEVKAGDVLLLRNIKAAPYRNEPICISNRATEHVAFPAERIPKYELAWGYVCDGKLYCKATPAARDRVSTEEHIYVIKLKADMAASIEQHGQNPNLSTAFSPLPSSAGHKLPERKWPLAELSGPAKPHAMEAPKTIAGRQISRSSGNKAKLVEELTDYMFADLCVQVAKIYKDAYGTVQLYVTDYTSNNLSWYFPPPGDKNTRQRREGDEFGYSAVSREDFGGPYEHFCFKINVKPPHSSYVAEHVKVADYVTLKNVKCKVLPHSALLEGTMWQDEQFPDRIKVNVERDHNIPEIMALNQRKERYWQDNVTLRPPVKERALNKAQSRAQRKKMKRKEREAAAKNGREVVQDTSEEVAATVVEQPSTNQHVRCANQEVRTIPLEEIIDRDEVLHHLDLPDGGYLSLPFINAKYRAKVRVVDFSPDSIEDFASPCDTTDEEASEDPTMTASDQGNKWEWFCSLQLEDAEPIDGKRERIWVLVAHQDVQYMLGNDMPDPADLRENRQLLIKLREKLHILWGNLEERKAGGNQEELSNKAFECCLMEYGLPFEGGSEANPEDWERLYRLFGVTIL